MRKSVIAIAASAVAMTVSATDYFYTDTNAALNDPNSWADSEGNHPENLFAAGDDYFLMNKAYWDHTIDFTARSLNLGSSSQDIEKTCSIGAEVGSGYGIDNFHVWGTSFLRINSGEKEFGGCLTIEGSGGYNFYYNSVFHERTHLSCAEDKYVAVKNSNTSKYDGSLMFLRLQGDYSQMRSHWFISGGAPTLVLESPTALGAADSTADYQGIRVQYANTLRFAVSNGVEFVGHDNKVISLRTYNGTASPVLELRTLPQFGADDYTVPVDIVKERTFADAIVNKVESGRVTLAKKCDADQLNVQDGTLRLARTATLKTALKVTVAAGAKLSLEKGGNFRVASLKVGDTVCAAGVYMKADLPDYLDGDGALQVGCTVPAKITVAYDPSTATATPVDLSGEAYLTRTGWKTVLGGGEIPVALSKAVTLPQLATNRMAVAYLPLSGGFMEGDFTDASEKSYGLPRTWFETEEQGGKTVLYLVVKPVMVATPYKGTTGAVIYDVANDAQLWTDGLVPHPGADYRNATYVSDDDAHFDLSGEFKGDSYSLSYCSSRLNDGDRNITVNLWLANQQGNQKSSLITWTSGAVALNGTIYVDATCPMARIKLKDNTTISRANSLLVNSDISGSGTLAFVNQFSKSRLNAVSLLGDNSGFSGPLILDGVLTSNQDALLEVTVTNGVALGGARPEMDRAGVLFDSFPKLIVNGNADFAAKNRCWASNNGLQVDVADGVSCQVRNPYYSSVDLDAALDVWKPNRCAIEKTGAGTLALAKVVPSDAEQNPADGNGKNDLIRVKEGGLMALAADTFAGCTVAFEDGAAIVVDPANAALAETGMVLDRAPTIAAGAKVGLVPAFAEAPTEDAAEVVFLTVPASTPDLSGVLVPRKVRSASGASMRGTLQKEDKVVGDRDCTVYSATYEVKGLVLVIQ